MFSFFQSVVAALIGMFLALLLVARIGDGEFLSKWISKTPNEDGATLSLQEMLPASAALLTAGMNNESLKEVEEAAEETDVATSTPEGETAPPLSPPPKELAPETKKENPPEDLKEGIPLLSASELNSLVRAATVNIFCTMGGTEAMSGSGVVIDERGIVLTNAHIAQYFLLDTYKDAPFVTCDIRTGSPARVRSKGELLYLPSRWIEAHAKDIDDETRDGVSSNGEHDYALVRMIPDPSAGTTTSLTFLSPAYGETEITRDESVLVASYPAGFLGAESLQKDLWLVSSFTEINELYNFASSAPGTIDVLSVHGVIGAQEGSSGGAVVRASDGTFLGLVVTRSLGDTTGERDLFALNTSYVNEDFLWDIKKTLQDFLASDIGAYQTWFNENVRPQLKERLLKEIEG